MNSGSILITGASGIIGRNLLQKLVSEEKGQIRLIYRDNSFRDSLKIYQKEIDEGRIVLLQGDINDPTFLLEAMRDISYVYHCAALVSFWKKNREALMKINVEGTANVVNACLANNVKKLAYISSIAALGRPAAGASIDEDTAWTDSRYNSQYAISKMLAEREVWRGEAEGLQTVIINPGVVLGEGDWHRSSLRIFKTLSQGFAFYPKGSNGFTDVNDVTNILIRLMKSDISGERFVTISGNSSFKDLFSMICEAYGQKPPRIMVNTSMAFAGAVILGLWSRFTGKEPILTFETARNSRADFFYDGSRITRRMDFSYTPLSETIQRSCRYYREQYQNR